MSTALEAVTNRSISLKAWIVTDIYNKLAESSMETGKLNIAILFISSFGRFDSDIALACKGFEALALMISRADLVSQEAVDSLTIGLVDFKRFIDEDEEVREMGNRTLEYAIHVFERSNKPDIASQIRDKLAYNGL